MDRYATILAALPWLEAELDRAGVREWLADQPTVLVDRARYFVLGGDRLATEAEAKLDFAISHGLVPPEHLQVADTAELPNDVETVDLDTSNEGDKG